jgi:hypothetical protein
MSICAQLFLNRDWSVQFEWKEKWQTKGTREMQIAIKCQSVEFTPFVNSTTHNWLRSEFYFGVCVLLCFVIATSAEFHNDKCTLLLSVQTNLVCVACPIISILINWLKYPLNKLIIRMR